MKPLRNPARQFVKTMLAVGFTSVLGIAPLFAQVTIYTDTLADLVANHGSLTIGDKTFSNFSALGSGFTVYNPATIQVTAIAGPAGIDYLQFVGNITLLGPPAGSADLQLGYTVTAGAGLISMIDQEYTGSAHNGDLTIDETASSSGAPTAHSDLSAGFGITDISDPNSFFAPNGTFDIGEDDLLSISPPQSTLQVIKDISVDVTGASPLDKVSISVIMQSFHQVPEPSAMLLGSLGAGLLVFLRTRSKATRD